MVCDLTCDLASVWCMVRHGSEYSDWDEPVCVCVCVCVTHGET